MANKARDFLARFVTDLTRFRTDDAERDMSQLADTSDKSARTIDRSFDKISRASQDTGHKLAAGKETAAESGREVGNEFAQNIGSGLAAGDISTIAQDSAGGLVAAFAGIGGPIGIALAGVATVATGIFASITAAAAKMSADIEASFQDIVTNADKQTRFENQLKQMFGTDSFTDALKQADQLAQETGVSLSDIRKVLTDSGANAQPLLDKLNAVKDAGTITASQAGRTYTTYTNQAQAADDLLGKLTRQRDVTSQAAGYARDLTNAMQDSADIIGALVGHGGDLDKAANRLSTISQQLGAAGRAIQGVQQPDYTSGGRS